MAPVREFTAHSAAEARRGEVGTKGARMFEVPLDRKTSGGRHLRAWWAVEATCLFVLTCAAQAQIDLSGGQRGADGTVYEVVALPAGPLSAGVESFRVTTVAGSVNGLSICSTSGSGPGQPTSAIVGADGTAPQPQVLHTYSAVDRTGILTPNNLTITFNPNNAGRLTIGTGAGAIDVCRVASDCTGGATDASIMGLASNGGGIPAACIATGVTAACSGPRNTFAFGLSASGDPPICSSSPTTTTTVCSAVPSDGFTITGGQVVVFIYDSGLGASGFTSGAAGFGIDTNGTNNPGCAPNTVVTADSQAPSAPPPPQPTPTPTNTPTSTPTPTATTTGTPTSTATPTMTVTPTLTAIPTPTFFCGESFNNIIPGYCHSIKNDCAQEFCTAGVPVFNAEGLPGSTLICKDDDPTCDFGPPGDKACTFHVALCYNVKDSRAPCIASGQVEEIKIVRPSQSSAIRSSLDAANRAALESALTAIGGVVKGHCGHGPKRGQVCATNADCDSSAGSGDGKCLGPAIFFTPPLASSNSCTPFASLKVPLLRRDAGTISSGKYSLRIRSFPPIDPLTGRRPLADGDILQLICKP
jgi:hypothetical protein